MLRLRLLQGLIAPPLVLACSLAGPAQRPWNQGDPTPEEQAALEWLNAARRDPVGTLDGLLGLARSDAVIAAFLAGQAGTGAVQLRQNLQAAWDVARDRAQAYPSSSAISTEPLALYPLFQARAAALGAGVQLPPPDAPAERPVPSTLYPTPQVSTLLSGPANLFGGPDATGGSAAFGPCGANYAQLDQANLYDPAITGREYVLSLLANPGSGSPAPSFLRQGDPLPGLTLGHTRMAGVSIQPSTGVGRTLTVLRASSEFLTQDDLPFGSAATVFVTGVAYRDSNSNGAYDPGEGIGGVTIRADRGEWCAVTAAAGGYAIPVPANSGDYILTAQGGPFAGPLQSVTVGSGSVKADWVLPALVPGPPPQVPVDPSDGSTQLVGLSSRGLVQAGDGALVGGFVISGPASARKRLLVRGVGPSLQTAGVAANSCIPATQLQLNCGPSPVASNCGWTNCPDGGAAVAAAAAQSGDFPLLDWAGGGGDSALVASLGPGAYTVSVLPAPGTASVFQTGRIGLVEIYDLSPGDGSRLVNLSARALAGSGDARLTVGCTVAGGGHERLLLRAAGPVLARYGLSGTLPEPVLTLNDSAASPVLSCGAWGLSPQTDQIRMLAASSGAFAFPEGSADSALVARLAPGNWTATVAAKPGSPAEGIALVELYEAP